MSLHNPVHVIEEKRKSRKAERIWQLSLQGEEEDQ